MYPTIVAICGASASGKDYLLKRLAPRLGASIIVSDTTRPKRKSEVNGIDYNFVDEDEFLRKVTRGGYLEYSDFRGWYYGTPRESVKPGLNVGVFNRDGLESLKRHSYDYKLMVIYMKAPVLVRVKRYIRRDGRFSLECLRRLLVDARQWFGFQRHIGDYSYRRMILKSCDIDKDLESVAQDVVSILQSPPISMGFLR